MGVQALISAGERAMSLRAARIPLFIVACCALAAVALAADHVEPMELRHNMPFVQVMVNGQGPFTFSIDTGTGGEALVSPALIKQLNLPVTGEAELGDPSGHNPQKAPTVKIQSLKVAGVEFNEVPAVQFQPSPREGQCDGILGFVLFRKYLLTLDYPQQQLRLAPGKLTTDGENTVVPFTMPNDVPVVQLKVGSQSVDAHVDSRGVGLSLPEKIAQGLKFASEPVVLGRGRTVSNDFEIKGAELSGDVHLGGYTFPHPFVIMNPVLPLANFGALPLHYFAVTFDQQDKLMQLESRDKNLEIPAPHRHAPAASAAPTTAH
jgi:hypothetical protein